MDETDWLRERANPQRMLDHVRDVCRAARTKLGRRRLRLIPCGCCRLIWEHLSNPQLRQVVEIGEQFADGLSTPEHLHAARVAADVQGNRGFTDDDINA